MVQVFYFKKLHFMTKSTSKDSNFLVGNSFQMQWLFFIRLAQSMRSIAQLIVSSEMFIMVGLRQSLHYKCTSTLKYSKDLRVLWHKYAYLLINGIWRSQFMRFISRQYLTSMRWSLVRGSHIKLQVWLSLFIRLLHSPPSHPLYLHQLWMSLLYSVVDVCFCPNGSDLRFDCFPTNLVCYRMFLSKKITIFNFCSMENARTFD